MIQNTTFRCPADLIQKIKDTADIKGMFISEFVNYSLDKNLPVKGIPHFKRSKDFEKIGVRIPEKLKNRILKNQNKLSDDIRKLKQWEIILQCVLLECDTKSQ